MSKFSKEKIIELVKDLVRKKFENEGTGHDWWHIERVWRTAKIIAKIEGGDLFVIQLGALLHDIADWKFHKGDDKAGSKAARKILTQYDVPSDIIEQVTYIIDNIYYKLGTNKHKMQTIEGKVVQDADRIDALGAIGIARAFAYGGYKNLPIYDPRIKPVKRRAASEVKKNPNYGSTINHFYEKLLLIRELMNTGTGRRIAKGRHDYIKKFLNQFYKEWNQ
jgi:uncharacterized protein